MSCDPTTLLGILLIVAGVALVILGLLLEGR